MSSQASQLGVPYKVLKEFLNRKVTVETSTGDSFRGVLADVEENLSMSLQAVKATLVDGTEKEMECVYIKGTRIRLINLPDSASDSLARLNRPPPFRGGRGGFRGGRGGGFRGGRR